MAGVRVLRTTLDGVTLQWCREVRSALPMHVHRTLQLGVLEAGKVTVDVDGGRVEAEAGDLLAFDPDRAHRLHAPTVAVTARVLEMAASVVRERLELGPEVPLPRLPPRIDDPPAADALRDVHDHFERQAPATSALDELLCHLYAAHGAADGPEPPAVSVDVARVRDRLAGDLTSRPTLDELAELAGGSRFQLARAFKRRFGLPPLTYHLQLRLERAKTMLAAGRPAVDVAVATGFADQSHLHRHFRRHTLLTPGAFARQLTEPPGRTRET